MNNDYERHNIPRKQPIGLVRLPLLEPLTPAQLPPQPTNNNTRPQKATPSTSTATSTSTPSSSSASAPSYSPQRSANSQPTTSRRPAFQPMVFLSNDSTSSESTKSTRPPPPSQSQSQSYNNNDDEDEETRYFSSSSDSSDHPTPESDDQKLLRRLEAKRKKIDLEILRFREAKLAEFAEYERRLREKLQRKQLRRAARRTSTLDEEGEGEGEEGAAEAGQKKPTTGTTTTTISSPPVKSSSTPDSVLATQILTSGSKPTYATNEKVESHLNGIFTPGYLPLLDHSNFSRQKSGDDSDSASPSSSSSSSHPLRPRSLSVSTQSAPVVPTESYLRRHSASDSSGRPLHPSLRHTSSYGPNATRLKSPKRVTFKFDNVMFVPSRSSPPERPPAPIQDAVEEEEEEEEEVQQQEEEEQNLGDKMESKDQAQEKEHTGEEKVTSPETPSPTPHVDTASPVITPPSQDEAPSTTTTPTPTLVPSLLNGPNGTSPHHKKHLGTSVRFSETVEVQVASDSPGQSSSIPLSSPLTNGTTGLNDSPPASVTPESLGMDTTSSTDDDDFLFDFDETSASPLTSPPSSPPISKAPPLPYDTLTPDPLQTYAESLRTPSRFPPNSLPIPSLSPHAASLPTHFHPSSFPRRPATKYLPDPDDTSDASTSDDDDIASSSLPAKEKANLLKRRRPFTPSSLIASGQKELPPLPVPKPHPEPQIPINTRFPAVPIPRPSPGSKLLNPFMSSSFTGAKGTPYESELAAEVARLAEEEGDVVGSVVGGLDSLGTSGRDSTAKEGGMSFSIRLKMEEERKMFGGRGAMGSFKGRERETGGWDVNGNGKGVNGARPPTVDGKEGGVPVGKPREAKEEGIGKEPETMVEAASSALASAVGGLEDVD